MNYSLISLVSTICFFVIAVSLMIISGFDHDRSRVNSNWCFDPFNLQKCFRSKPCNSMIWNEDGDFVKYGCLWDQKRESRIVRYNHNGAVSTSVTESSTIATGCAYFQYTCDRLYSNSECLVKNDATLKYIYADDRDRICSQLQDREASFTHSIWYVLQIVSVWCYMLALSCLALYVYFNYRTEDVSYGTTISTIKTVKYSKIAF